MPVITGGTDMSASGASITPLINIAGTADNTVTAARADTLANLAADSDANDRDLAAKINEIRAALITAGIINR